MRLKLDVSRRLTIVVYIQTAETYMIYESYICTEKHKGQANRESNQAGT